MPDNWHEEGFSIVQAIQDVALLFLRGQEITWHHAMKKLVPRVCSHIVFLMH
ncbi:hypothetical protein CSC2_16470 [Clostridium zeae]|uniref:Uncharacterized protein n=1 Tax=Clostridium zeae TaxID=2759022 RepID=A0ABQ1E8R6_9CLOT|nr:hypothetical protein [Clostridium zeae]GFZ31121.1 hypothetical protein CSC2_16470 [Clostridium zeae]